MPGTVDGSSVFSIIALSAKGKVVCRSKSPPPCLQIIVPDNIETEILAMVIFVISEVIEQHSAIHLLDIFTTLGYVARQCE